MGELRGLLLRVFAGLGLCTATATAVDRTLLQESFVPIPVDLAVDRRLDAYVPHYKLMLPLVTEKNPISAIELRQVADAWIRDLHRGMLLPLEGNFHGEDLVESPKAQLVNATKKIAAQLTRVAEVELDNGRIEDGVSDALRANAMIDSIRFISPTTMVMTAGVARRAMKLASDHISKAQVIPNHLLVHLQKNGDVEKKYQEMLRRTQHQKLIYSVRYGQEDAEQIAKEQYENVEFRSQRSAHRFFGFESEDKLVKGAQACQFANTLQTQ